MNQKDKVEWRRNKVQELLVKGYNHYEIASALQISSRSTITRDIQYLREHAKHNIKKYIDEVLPEEYEKTLAGLTAILKEMWAASEKAQDTKEKVLALSLAKEVYSMKLDLLSNVSTVEATMKFIDDYKNNNNNNRTELQKPLVSNNENEINDFSTSNIEETTTTTTTTNKVF